MVEIVETSLTQKKKKKRVASPPFHSPLKNPQAEVQDGTRTLERFEADVTRYRQQLLDIKALPDLVSVGIIQIDLKGMKAAMLPYPQRCLDEIHALLPVLGAELYQVNFYIFFSLLVFFSYPSCCTAPYLENFYAFLFLRKYTQ